MTYDLIVRRARLRDGRLVDIGVAEGRIVAIEAELPGEATETIDAAGRLLSPPLIEPHCHLDAALTEGLAGHNETGTLLEGIQRWAQTKPQLTVEAVKERAKRAIEWYASQGALVIRSHVDVCDPNFIGLRALLEVREEMRHLVDLQLVAFPQEGSCPIHGVRNSSKKPCAWVAMLWVRFHTTRQRAKWGSNRCGSLSSLLSATTAHWTHTAMRLTTTNPALSR